eukprot:CAMPEP_0196659326 /NCGR_PEP_ID=MMETSP1086-20130531/34378_1 /TAXON_ID=77921 /ORGANISM="Cyanoptyche  gloeocystis , Strain SAG4.97" /LENGTH=56 /DNA_ID=CAMNT_0041993259 /DNA_START=114 /DNA_END=281 /DNA_ORIENTATION=-
MAQGGKAGHGEQRGGRGGAGLQGGVHEWVGEAVVKGGGSGGRRRWGGGRGSRDIGG